ncbi:hypothetical protein BOTCAL_0217g00070 [Botryotinia calthae]|uniref:NmrA-like domain-containing protein n=1 Tax=Botryotinia calthae TaxID=38488 RepID=A0A4Y8D0K0_9HELO|nr:hypothetical protein BOTCAL_0217g00070 [Botryotinia calthae]
MTDKKLVVVLGATGAQHLSDTYRVRAVACDPTKPSAEALSKSGAEVVSVDYDIPDSIKAALSGAHAIFAITNFWEQNSLETEVILEFRAEDTGMAIGEVLRGGKKFFGRQVVLFGEPIPEEERLKIWADELGIKARFEQVSPEQHAERLSSYELPPDVVVASTELVEALPYEESMLMSGRHVQTEEYLPNSYKLVTWVDYDRKEDWLPLRGA